MKGVLFLFGILASAWYAFGQDEGPDSVTFPQTDNPIIGATEFESRDKGLQEDDYMKVGVGGEWIPIGGLSGDKKENFTDIDTNNLAEPSSVDEDEDSETQQFIVNGRRARRKRQPWMATVQIYYYGYWYHICGATLIQSHKLVVAAHCMWLWRRRYYYRYYGYYYYYRFRVGLGWYDLREGTRNRGSQTYYIRDVDFHPSYRYRNGKVFQDNDIAILTLSKCAIETSTVAPIRSLATSSDRLDYTDCTITGWGATLRGGSSRYILQQATVTHISRALCWQFWRRAGIKIPNTQICTLDWPYDLSNTCFGDSGGPVICRGKFAGIISWGLAYCNGCMPDVHTRIASYRKWIAQTIHE